MSTETAGYETWSSLFTWRLFQFESGLTKPLTEEREVYGQVI